MPTGVAPSKAPMLRPASKISRSRLVQLVRAAVSRTPGCRSRGTPSQSSSPIVRTGNAPGRTQAWSCRLPTRASRGRASAIHPMEAACRALGAWRARPARTAERGVTGGDHRYCRGMAANAVGAASRPGRHCGGDCRCSLRRHVLHSDGFVLLALSLCTAALGVLNTEAVRAPGSRWRRSPCPCSSGGFLLSVRSLLLLYVVVAAVGIFESSQGSRSVGSVLRRVRDRRDRAAVRPQPRPPRRPGHARRLDAGRPARPAARPGRDAGAARGLVGGGRAAFRGRRLVLRRLPRLHPVR